MSSWQLNRVGLLDFWYYDDQDFETVDGRILLRGSNGSGKSVTMQSFIPLLLDGNMRPERLDPFGSRARKMENYLLEEEDDREERTGYLYMEFKREDSEVYETVGIGLRARKNKKMETWYFSLTDGRRVGKDFFLYKDLQSKITCSKQELKNRLGEGGRIMESQSEYVRCVNQLLFGFETIEEYQELIELLLQLRTPKLSKDFKPTVINEILSRSLQTLSEDDLRPMSEAIENMDAQETNLAALNESILAAEAIHKVYRQYNEIVLYDKALLFSKASGDYKAAQKKAEEMEKQRADYIEQGENEKKRCEQLEQEETILKKEYDSLKDSDASRLKEDEIRLLNEMEEKKQELEQKERQEQEKNEKYIETQNTYRRQEEENQQIWEKITGHLEEMEQIITEVPFDEFAFMKEEINQKPGEEYEFGAHCKQLRDYKNRVEAGRNVLIEEKNGRERYDKVQQELDQAAALKDKKERSCRQQENLLQEEKSRAIEVFHEWEKANTQLHLAEAIRQNITIGIEGYHWGKDYVEIRDLARNSYYEKEAELNKKIHLRTQEKDTLQGQIRNLEDEFEEWKNKEDPEPECSEAVLRNRRLLEKEQIPFLPFYKTIDFESQLTKEQASGLEEMLLEMGLLNALIIPAEYRKKVLQLDKGVCDKYIFSDVRHIKENLNTILDVDNGENDILFYQTVSNILSSIGVFSLDEQDSGSTWIDLSGHYKIGVLEGTITREYEAHYVGLRARQKYREKKLTELAAALDGLQQELAAVVDEITRLEEAKRINEKEWQSFPGGEDLKEAAKMLYECEAELENAERMLQSLREQLAEKKKELDEIILRVRELCSSCYMTVRLDVFEKALECLNIYDRLLTEVRIAHEKYRNGIQHCMNKKEIMDDIDADLDEIRYEKGKISRKYQELEANLYSIREQLKLTNYEEIKERLDFCLERLAKLPGEKTDAIQKAQRWETKTENLQEELKNHSELLLDLRKTVGLYERAFQAEYRLGYVGKNYVITGDMEDQANKTVEMLAGHFGNKKQSDIFAALQEAYHGNKGELREYQLTLQSVFEELDEETDFLQMSMKRIDIQSQYRGVNIRFSELLERLYEDREVLQKLLTSKDKELFEDILANTISKKIRAKIQSSRRWVEKMNILMDSMQTSSGLKLSLNWKSKRAEAEGQLDTRQLVELLQKDSEIMRQEEVEKLSLHFRSKIGEARKLSNEGNTIQSFHAVMREVLDYRKWFEFTLECQKTGEKKKELTDRVFFTFSGGEKAMSMYVPLFSAVVAKYAGAREEAPRLVSLDEAFAGVDEMNIRDMFRLMRECRFNFMINSQVLWGDYDTMPGLAIYQLLRPENAKFVTVIKYVWNGKEKVLCQNSC